MLLPPVTEKVNVPAAAGVPIAVKVTALVPVSVNATPEIKKKELNKKMHE